MMKYRFLFASVDSSPKVGGVSLLAKRLSRDLLKAYGEEAVYLGPKGTHFTGGEMPMKVYEDYQSETSLRAGSNSLAEDERIQDLAGAIIDNYDLNCIVLWHPFYYGPGLIAAARERGLPLAVFVHGTELTSQISGAKDGPVDFDYDPTSTDLDQRLYGIMDQAGVILTNSSYSAQVIKNVVPDKTVSIVRCGIDAAIFERELEIFPAYSQTLKLMAREDIGLPECKTLVHVGRLVPHKNQRQSIELIQQEPDMQLVVIGDGPDREELEQLSQKLAVTDRVFFLGEVDDETKWKYLRASDAGLLISTYNEATGGYEGFGITMVEYTAAGCAVISSGKYGMHDYAQKYECAFLALHDDRPVKTHAKRVYEFLSDDAILGEHVDKTRMIAQSRFKWSDVAERVMEAVKSV